MTHRDRPFCSERSVRALARVGQAVNLAIERFVTVGETIADDNPEIKCEMYEACKDARSAGMYLEIYATLRHPRHTTYLLCLLILILTNLYMISATAKPRLYVIFSVEFDFVRFFFSPLNS